MIPRRRTAVLISGRGSNMMSLIEAARTSDYPAEIALVVSNRPDAYGLVRAAEAGIATAVLDHKAFEDREAFEQAIDTVLREHQIEIVCLAGFMRVLTPFFIERWVGRLLNIHPSLLPAFRGLHTHERALAEGVKLHGCTVHHVVPELDAGPIIAQGAVPVLADDTPDTLGARVLEVEHRLYPMALALVARDQAAITEGRVLIGGGDGKGLLISPAL
jgi:phosphoribosylglycinamide formyltransferase-1